MTSERVEEVLLENMKMNIAGFEVNQLDRSLSMADYGASSLDMLEITAGTLNDLGIRLPRKAFANIRNIGSLIDLLATTVREAGGD